MRGTRHRLDVVMLHLLRYLAPETCIEIFLCLL